MQDQADWLTAHRAAGFGGVERQHLCPVRRRREHQRAIMSGYDRSR